MTKFLRIFRASLIILLLLAVGIPVAVYVVLSTPWMQNRLCNVAAEELTELLGTQVEIGRVDYRPFNTIAISEIEIDDENGRCALSVEMLKARFELTHFLRTGRLQFDYAVLETPQVCLYRTSPQSPLNVQPIFDRLKSDKPDRQPKNFDLKIDVAMIRNGRMTYDVLSAAKSQNPFDANHIEVNDLSLYAYLRHASPEHYDIDLETLSFREKSGLKVNHLATNVVLTPTQLSLKKFDFRMSGTSIQLKPFALALDGINSIGDALKREVLLVETYRESTIAPADFSCFAPQLAKLRGRYMVDMAVDATLKKVNLQRLALRDLYGAVVELRGSIENPDSLEIAELDLSKINVYIPVASSTEIASAFKPELASRLNGLGTIRVSGEGAGNLKGAHLNLEVGAGNAKASFKGDVATPNRYRSIAFNGRGGVENLNLGELLGKDEFGEVSASLSGKATIAGALKAASGELDISKFEWRDYAYSGVKLQGDYNGNAKTILAKAVSTDPHASFALNVDADLNDELKDMILACEISRLDISELNLAKGGYSAAGKISSEFSGKNLSDIYGFVSLDSLQFCDTLGKTLAIEKFEINARRTGPSRTITVNSDFLNGSVDGKFSPQTLVITLKDIASHIAPGFFPNSVVSNEAHHQNPAFAENDFAVDLNISNSEKISDFLKLPITIYGAADITASVDGHEGLASLTVDAPVFLLGKNYFDSSVLGIDVSALDNTAVLYATTHTTTKKGPMTLVLGINGHDNRFDTNIDWAIDHKNQLNGVIGFSTAVSRTLDDKISVSTDFQPGTINFGDDVWNISPSSISWHDNTLIVDDFSLRTADNVQHIHIDGRASKLPEDELLVKLCDIQLESIFSTLSIDNAMIGGRATGDVTVTQAFSSVPVMQTEKLHVDSIGYNHCTIGTADIRANWNNDKQSFYLDADIVNPEGLPSRIWGDIYAARGALDLNFDAQHVRVGFMQKFMSAFASSVKGYVSGNARLYGTFSDVDMEADLFAEDLKLKIDFTNTWYSATDSIHVSPGLIALEDIEIHDVYGNRALLNGWLKHTYFHYPEFDFKISEAENFLSYNTTSLHNPDWYGTVYGTGGAQIIGKPGSVEILVDMATAPGSTFTFVLNDRLDAEQYSFITFNDRTVVDEKEKRLLEESNPVALVRQLQNDAQKSADKPSAYKMDLAVDITPDAQMTLVMDPDGGDRIRARGFGDLRLRYDSYNPSDIFMKGTYTLNEGRYNFTLQDVIIKDFKIDEGSSITFNGDPYAAQLNVNAIYELNANLQDLDASFAQDREISRTNVRVQAKMAVTGDMRQPNLKFDLGFPEFQTDNVYRKVKSIISTEEMMNRQIIFLLALSRFSTPDYMAANASSNQLFTIASSAITSQLSSMLSKVSDDWSIAPNLRSDMGDFSDLQVDVLLQGRLLNNRLLINGNFGYRDESLNSNQLVGDVTLEYLLNRRGTWRMKGYNRFNEQNFYMRDAETTQGGGIMFRKDFDELFPFLRKKKEQPADSVAPKK